MILTSFQDSKNRYRKIFLLYLSVHWGDLIEQIKKKICHIHFKMIHRDICTVAHSINNLCQCSDHRQSSFQFYMVYAPMYA